MVFEPLTFAVILLLLAVVLLVLGSILAALLFAKRDLGAPALLRQLQQCQGGQLRSIAPGRSMLEIRRECGNLPVGYGQQRDTGVQVPREPVAHNPIAHFSTDELKSAQIPVTAMDLGVRTGQEQAETPRSRNPEQTLLLPPSPLERLPANQLAFLLLDLASELDLAAILALVAASDRRGVKAQEPRMETQSSARRLVVRLLYACCLGIPSWR